VIIISRRGCTIFSNPDDPKDMNVLFILSDTFLSSYHNFRHLVAFAWASNTQVFTFCFALSLLLGCGGGGGGQAETPAPFNLAPVLTLEVADQLAEGQIGVGTFSAEDPNNDDFELSTSGADAALFAVSASGEIYFTKAPDFELPTDANQDNVYELTLTAADANLSTSSDVNVQILNEFEGRVIDGPVANSSIHLDLNNNDLIDIDERVVASDENGFFLIPSFQPEEYPLAKIIASGGSDAATGKALPNLVLVSDLLDTTNKVGVITPLSTLLTGLDDQTAEKILQSFGLQLGTKEIASTDPWESASKGDQSGQDFQSINQQIAIILQTVTSISGLNFNENSAALIEVIKKTSEIISNLRLNNSGELDTVAGVYEILASANTLEITDVALSEEALGSISRTVSALNVIFSNGAINPTSDQANEIIGEIQSELKDQVVSVANGSISHDDFKAATDISTLLSDLETSEQFSDSDNDGIINLVDSDDDDDGFKDTVDAFPIDASESLDTDLDGIGNNADSDDDGDGVLDSEDAFPLDERPPVGLVSGTTKLMTLANAKIVIFELPDSRQSGSKVEVGSHAVSDINGEFEVSLSADYRGGPILVELVVSDESKIRCLSLVSCGEESFGLMTENVGDFSLKRLVPSLKSISGPIDVGPFDHITSTLIDSAGSLITSAAIRDAEISIGNVLQLNSDLHQLQRVAPNKMAELADTTLSEQQLATLSFALAGSVWSSATLTGSEHFAALYIKQLEDIANSLGSNAYSELTNELVDLFNSAEAAAAFFRIRAKLDARDSGLSPLQAIESWAYLQKMRFSTASREVDSINFDVIDPSTTDPLVATKEFVSEIRKTASGVIDNDLLDMTQEFESELRGAFFSNLRPGDDFYDASNEVFMKILSEVAIALDNARLEVTGQACKPSEVCPVSVNSEITEYVYENSAEETIRVGVEQDQDGLFTYSINQNFRQADISLAASERREVEQLLQSPVSLADKADVYSLVIDCGTFLSDTDFYTCGQIYANATAEYNLANDQNLDFAIGDDQRQTSQFELTGIVQTNSDKLDIKIGSLSVQRTEQTFVRDFSEVPGVSADGLRITEEELFDISIDLETSIETIGTVNNSRFDGKILALVENYLDYYNLSFYDWTLRGREIRPETAFEDHGFLADRIDIRLSGSVSDNAGRSIIIDVRVEAEPETTASDFSFISELLGGYEILSDWFYYGPSLGKYVFKWGPGNTYDEKGELLEVSNHLKVEATLGVIGALHENGEKPYGVSLILNAGIEDENTAHAFTYLDYSDKTINIFSDQLPVTDDFLSNVYGVDFGISGRDGSEKVVLEDHQGVRISLELDDSKSIVGAISAGGEETATIEESSGLLVVRYKDRFFESFIW